MIGGGCLFCIFLVLAEIKAVLRSVQRPTPFDYDNICKHHFSQGCPIYDGDSWRCAKLLTNCSGDQLHRYHCVLNSTGKPFMVVHICAPIIKCDKGTIPIYDKRNDVISCEPCRDGYYQPGAAWSDETPDCFRKHTCERENKIECDMGTELRYTADTYCRCDARNNYVLTDWEIRGKCVEWVHATCYYHPCPDGQERLLNYSCASLCPQGQKRDDNDICVLIGIADQNTTYIKVNKTVADIPDAPGTPKISDLTSRKVTVRWKHSLVDNNSPITSYIVTIKSEGFSLEDGQIYEVSSNTSYIIITDLTPNTAYQVRVTARNAIGLGPPSSPSEIFFTLPKILADDVELNPGSNFLPLQLAAHSVESDKIEISWKAPPPDTINGVLQGYEIQYGIVGENIMTTITIDGTKESVVIQGVKPFTNYRIAVRAFNNANRGPAAITYVRNEEERTIDHTTTSINQDQDIQSTGVIDHTTRSVNQDQDTESTDSPFIRYLLYIIPGIGFTVGVGLCLLKKFKCWPCVDGESKNNPRSNSDINSGHENLQLQNSSQQYWTIVSNARGEVSTALETNINMELDENIYRSHHNHAELEAYIHPIHSDSLELDQSYSSSVEFDGYIDPIPSEPVEHDGYVGSIPSEPVDHDGHIHPIPSEPVEHDVYIEPIP